MPEATSPYLNRPQRSEREARLRSLARDLEWIYRYGNTNCDIELRARAACALDTLTMLLEAERAEVAGHEE